jgi:hypothetical protein
MSRARSACFALLSIAACHSASPRQSVPAVEYRNGRWFDGARFVDRTMWVVGDRFAESAPAGTVTVVDLAGGFVVPPYAEGHNHWLEPGLVDAYVQTYLRDGVFYVRDQGTPPRIHDAMRPALGGPASVDFVSAHQGFPGPGGHPMELVDQLAAFGVLPAEWATTHGEGEALFAVASEAEVDRAWPTLLAGQPDFVKIFLVHSDEYAARRDDAALTPKQRGIDPALVPAIVGRAHAAGLRVSAHVENAHDFHVAVEGGVDEIAHMPFVAADAPDAYLLADGDCEAAGRRGLSISTTLDFLGDAPAPRQLEVARANLLNLRRHGVRIALGTDLFRQTPRVEVERIARFELLTNLELLTAWAVTTPQVIFPDRKLGRLAADYEASFLVLKGDPLLDAANLGRIVLRVKQGRTLVPGPATIPPLGG